MTWCFALDRGLVPSLAWAKIQLLEMVGAWVRYRLVPRSGTLAVLAWALTLAAGLRPGPARAAGGVARWLGVAVAHCCG